MTVAPCPACEARNAEPAAENPAHIVNTGGHIFESRIVNVLCRDCGLIYNDPMPTELELVSLYEAMARDIADRPSAPPRIMPIEREQAEYVAPVLAGRAAPKVLDVGCSMGGFLAAVTEGGAAGVGIEPSPHDAAVARTRFGLDVREGFLEDLTIDERFDLITLRFVFEHVRDPRGILRRLHGLLAPGGRVYLEVPNLATPFVGFDDFFSYGHLQTFTPESLAYLCAREGFAVERMDVCANVFESSPHPPSIRVILSANPQAAVPPAPVDAVRAHLAAYRASRGRLVARASTALRTALEGRARAVVYGAGTHTAELWHACPFLEGRVTAMVDGNPRLQGHPFLGVPVHSPRALADLDPDLIVISVRTAERQIADFLAKEGFGPRTLRLYEENDAAAA